MKIYSNNPIPDTLRWKGEQTLIAINKKENHVLSEEDEGKRYEADFTVSESSDEKDIVYAINRMLNDKEHDNAFIFNFTKEIKTYQGEIPEIKSSSVVFDPAFEKQPERLFAKNMDADNNIKKLAGNIKNYIADLTDGVRTSATDADINILIADGNIIITNE